MNSQSPLRKAEPAACAPLAWRLRLYVAGPTANSAAAFRNLKQICEEHLAGRYHIEVIDLKKSPQLAEGGQILAVPTLVRELPAPIRKIIGTLSNTERVLVGLDLPRREESACHAGKGENHVR